MVPDLPKGHFFFVYDNLIASEYLQETQHSLVDKRSPIVGIGTAENETSDCGRENDLSRSRFFGETRNSYKSEAT